MTKKDFAKSIFDRIGDGHLNAVGRPDDDIIDRYLRRLIEHENHNGDCIIAGRTGYYRPIPGDSIDEAEYKLYLNSDRSRINKLTSKQTCMRMAFEMRRLEIWFAQGKVRERQVQVNEE